MTRDEKRFIRRELINYFLQNKPYPLCKNPDPFFIHDITFMVRNSELYRYNMELNIYSKGENKMDVEFKKIKAFLLIAIGFILLLIGICQIILQNF